MQCFGQYAHARGNFAECVIPVGIEPTTKTDTSASTISCKQTFCLINVINCS